MARRDNEALSITRTGDETTPLLTADTAQVPQSNEEEVQHPDVAGSDSNDNDEDEKPLPKDQIFLLCFLRLVEPIAFFAVFPFINKMIWEIGGVKKADVGFYSGLIESLFSVSQMCLMITWGRAADRFGRKPVMITSLIGIGAATFIFALSRSIWQMIVFRCLAGIFAGNVVTIRAMVSENCTPKTQAKAFGLFAFTGNLGIFIAPLIGGVFSEPAKQYPSMFGKIQFFKDFPYALPSFVVSAISFIAALLSVVFLKETLKRKTVDGKPAPPPMSTWQILKYPGIAMCLYLFGHTMFIAFAFASVTPLFLFTDVQLGGLGFSPLQISLFIGGSGLLQAISVLFIFPPLHKILGTKSILKACGVIWPISYALWPVANYLLKYHHTVFFWTLIALNNIIGSAASIAFTAAQLIINDISPSPSTLGTVNGIALTLVSGLRAVAPALFASIFATGARTQVLGGYLVWLVLVLLVTSYAILVRYLPAKADGKPGAKR